MAVNIAFTGGGTAGHVLPNIALIETTRTKLGQKIKEKVITPFYFGSKNGMEVDIVKKSDLVTYIPISSGKLRRYFSWENFLSPFFIAKGFFEARAALKKNKIKVLFSKGGFVSAPVVWAAWTLSIPVLIHESDFSPALTTKLTQPCAFKIFTAFEETRQHMSKQNQLKTTTIGIPLRDELFDCDKNESIKHFKLNTDLPVLLVFGGSLGAAALNELIKPILPSLDEKMNVIHLTGKGKSFPVEGLKYYHQFEFLSDDMALALTASDFAFCRAGASSIFELAALKKPMLLLPLGLKQSRGDQIENARYFTERKWASMIDEEGLTSDKLLPLLLDLSDDIEVRKVSLESAPTHDGQQKISECIVSLLNM